MQQLFMEHMILNLKTHETTIQKHDGEEIYRIDREVKYLGILRQSQKNKIRL